MAKGKAQPTTLASLIEPFGANLVVTRPRAVGRYEVRQTASGVFLPADTRTEYGRVCRVEKVGPDVKAVKPGDTVLVAEFAGLPIYTEADENEMFVVGEGDVIARVGGAYWSGAARE
jgi:co-chaperonin GroES (HSP10)